MYARVTFLEGQVDKSLVESHSASVNRVREHVVACITAAAVAFKNIDSFDSSHVNVFAAGQNTETLSSVSTGYSI